MAAPPAATPPAAPLSLTTNANGLVERTGPNGTSVTLDGRFESAVIARRNADGSISTECHDEAHEAEAFMARQAAPQPAQLEVQ